MSRERSEHSNPSSVSGEPGPATVGRKASAAAAATSSGLASLSEWWRDASDRRLVQLIEAQGADRGARAYVEELRWPEGVSCVRCSSARIGWLESREKYYCRECHYQFRVTAGTVLHDSHLSLSQWLYAVELILASGRGFPANQLRWVLGTSYKSAWFIGHRIRSAMSQSLIESGMPVALAQAVVEADSERAATPASSDLGETASQGWKLVRTLVAGAYRRPSIEHLTAYWNESRWRAAHVDNDHVFRETVRALLDTEPLPYRQLIDPTRLAAVRGSGARLRSSSA